MTALVRTATLETIPNTTAERESEREEVKLGRREDKEIRHPSLLFDSSYLVLWSHAYITHTLWLSLRDARTHTHRAMCTPPPHVHPQTKQPTH